MGYSEIPKGTKVEIKRQGPGWGGAFDWTDPAGASDETIAEVREMRLADEAARAPRRVVGDDEWQERHRSLDARLRSIMRAGWVAPGEWGRIELPSIGDEGRAGASFVIEVGPRGIFVDDCMGDWGPSKLSIAQMREVAAQLQAVCDEFEADEFEADS